MNLHITHDDKFIDIFIRRQQRLFPDQKNKYIIYHDSQTLTYVKSPEVLFAPLHSKKFTELIGNLNQYTNIYIHYFSPLLTNFVLSIPPTVKVTWLFWGSDAFYLPTFVSSIYTPKTLAIINQYYPHEIYRLSYSRRWFIASIKGWFKRNKDARRHIAAMNRIDYFGHYLPEDYQLIRKATGMKAQLLDFNYGSVNDFAAPVTSSNTENALLLGNSADASNNHIEALEAIARTGGNTKVYCPLSYAGYPEYIQQVIKTGNKLLGERFIPLTNFIPKQQYDEMMGAVKYVVMNHRRSQAFGNITAQLSYGNQLYMNSYSTLYKFLTGLGLEITTLNNLNRAGLPPYQKNETNINLINRYFGNEAVDQRYRNVLSINQH
jgi:hypothetical protein